MTGIKKETGGSAFPIQNGIIVKLGDHEHTELETESGLTIRDYFAIKAMQSEIINGSMQSEFIRQHLPEEQFQPAVAMASYRWADAMLKERNK